MTEKKLTYDELMERNRRLANMLIRRNEEFEQTLRAEVKKAKANAWDECEGSWEDAHKMSHHEPWEYMKENPYKEES